MSHATIHDGVFRTESRSTPELPCSPALASQWHELCRSSSRSPFSHKTWYDIWWRAFGRGKSKIVCSGQPDDGVQAVMPVIEQGGYLGSMSNIHAPCVEILSATPSAKQALARSLFSGNPRHVKVGPLVADSDDPKVLRRAAHEAGYRFVIRPWSSSPFLELNGSWPEYEHRLGKSLTRNLRRARRRLRHAGAVSFHVERGGPLLEHLLEEAFRVESSGWKGRRGTSIRDRESTRAFYSELARWSGREGLLRLFLLMLNGLPIAMCLALAYDNKVHLLKGGYDEAFREFSPGKLLMHDIIEHSFHARMTHIEFHGDADAYKLEWSNGVRRLVFFEAFDRSVPGLLHWLTLKYVKPALSFAAHRARRIKFALPGR